MKWYEALLNREAVIYADGCTYDMSRNSTDNSTVDRAEVDCLAVCVNDPNCAGVSYAHGSCVETLISGTVAEAPANGSRSWIISGDPNPICSTCDERINYRTIYQLNMLNNYLLNLLYRSFERRVYK